MYYPPFFCVRVVIPNELLLALLRSELEERRRRYRIRTLLESDSYNGSSSSYFSLSDSDPPSPISRRISTPTRTYETLEVNNSNVRTASSWTKNSITSQFKESWAKGSSSGVQINEVLEIHNSYLENRFENYKRSLSDANVRTFWHGTKVECSFPVHSPYSCSSSSCAACNIPKEGFKLRCAQTNHNFARFGRGLYFAHNSSKANDYTSPNSTTGLRVVFQCDVACGKVYRTQYDMTSLTSPPSGYDSVEGVPGGSLNYPEMVVYNEDAVMPRYIVFYKYN